MYCVQIAHLLSFPSREKHSARKQSQEGGKGCCLDKQTFSWKKENRFWPKKGFVPDCDFLIKLNDGFFEYHPSVFILKNEIFWLVFPPSTGGGLKGVGLSELRTCSGKSFLIISINTRTAYPIRKSGLDFLRIMVRQGAKGGKTIRTINNNFSLGRG